MPNPDVSNKRTLAIFPGMVYRFVKSGSAVRAVTPSGPYLGQPTWTVERVGGTGKGKQMVVTANALVDVDSALK